MMIAAYRRLSTLPGHTRDEPHGPLRRGVRCGTVIETHGSLGKEIVMTPNSVSSGWATAAVLAGRLIFAAAFIMAVSFKLMDINATAQLIASAGFPFPLVLAWLAALFELALIACFLTGAYFSEAALLAAAYVLFLAFAFHGPSHWAENKAEFGFFVDHFTFFAGLLFAAAHGPGRVLAMKAGRLHAQP